jgi:hypothetical protein
MKDTDRRLLFAGIAAGIMFIAVASVEMTIRPGFDIRRHAISMLSLGKGGWVMATTFVVTGLLTLLCAIGLRRALVVRGSGVAVATLVGLYGVGLILAGFFAAPASFGFPPGTPVDQAPVMTPAAIVHSISFMLAFGSLIIACFVLARPLTGWRSAASIAAGVSMPLLIAFGMTNMIAVGVAFFAAAIVAWAWIAAVALHLARVKGPAARNPLASSLPLLEQES